MASTRQLNDLLSEYQWERPNVYRETIPVGAAERVSGDQSETEVVSCVVCGAGVRVAEDNTGGQVSDS